MNIPALFVSGAGTIEESGSQTEVDTGIVDEASILGVAEPSFSLTNFLFDVVVIEHSSISLVRLI